MKLRQCFSKNSLLLLLTSVSLQLFSESFVSCDLMGQLGNQFFQIAATTSLALDNEATAVFPTLTTNQDFNIPLNHEKIFYHLNTNEPASSVEHVYIEPQFPYAAIPYKPNMLIRGWFQSENYFRHHKDKIIPLFAPSDDISDFLSQKYASIIEQENTVSIHYRSYAKEDPEQRVYIDCGQEYLAKAIEQLPEDSLFVVFSNNISLCKKHLDGIERNFIYIEGEAYYHDLYLMSMCKHHIISNSSFSWWGAYLNTHPNKRVIAPAKWFNPNYGANTKDLLPPEWEIL